ncbi:metal ABC transporter permease [Deinococcus aestuarii]|uniref:metal ABC transporter permease n=1 Tax=Deinococcus aestuarii TaxID=2774531 RepID=UPI001C0AA4AB
MNPLDLLTDYTLRSILLGSALLGLVAGTLGTFSVLRRQSLIGDTVAHAALPGICAAFLLTGTRDTLGLLLGGGVSGLAASLLALAILRYSRLKEDAALGVTFSAFFGIGIAMLTAIGQSGNAAQAGLDKFLFGQAAALTQGDVIRFALLGALALGTAALLHKELKISLFDPDFARVQGWPVPGLTALSTALTVLAVMIGLQTVGVVLMAAMLIAPAVAARQWMRSLSGMLGLAGAFGALSGALGAGLSLGVSSGAGSLPTGAVTVLAATALAVLSLLVAPRRGVLAELVRQRRVRARLLRELNSGGQA